MLTFAIAVPQLAKMTTAAPTSASATTTTVTAGNTGGPTPPGGPQPGGSHQQDPLRQDDPQQQQQHPPPPPNLSQLGPQDIVALVRGMHQQLQLQQQQHTHMINVLNGIMGHIANGPNVPNLTGWPLTTPNTGTDGIPGQNAPGIGLPAAPTMGFGVAHPSVAATPSNNSIVNANQTGSGATQSLQNAHVTDTCTNAGTSGLNHQTPAMPVSSGVSLPNLSQPPPPLQSTASTQAITGPRMSTQYTAAFGQQTAASVQSTAPPLTGTASRETHDDGFDGSDSAYSGAGARPRYRSQGRGSSAAAAQSDRRRLRAREQDQISVRNIPTEEYDDDDGYALNREREEAKSCKSLFINSFSHGNKEQDFTLWVQQFEEAVNKALNPHSKRKHHALCLQWISNSLTSDAFAIYKRAENIKTNWEKLKKELEIAFEDPAIRAAWKTDLRAYVWDEKIPLQSYYAKVMHYVDIFETEMADFPAAIKGQYYMRFVNGLPEDYMQQVRLNIPTNNTSIEKALDICIRWQGYKNGESKKEVAAAITFGDRSMPSRVTKMEADVQRLMNKFRNKDSNQSTTQDSISGSDSPSDSDL